MKIQFWENMSHVEDPITLMQWGLSPEQRHTFQFGALRIYYQDNDDLNSGSSAIEHKTKIGKKERPRIEEIIENILHMRYSGYLIVTSSYSRAEGIQMHLGLIKLKQKAVRNCMSFRAENSEPRIAEVAPVLNVELDDLRTWLGGSAYGMCIFLPDTQIFDVRDIFDSNFLSEKGYLIKGKVASGICDRNGVVIYTVGMANPRAASTIICAAVPILESLMGSWGVK